MEKHALNILIVDDNDVTAALTCELMEIGGHTATCAFSATDALRAVIAQAFDVALLDIGLPDRSEAELALQLRKDFPRMALIAITGFPSAMCKGHTGACCSLTRDSRDPSSSTHLKRSWRRSRSVGAGNRTALKTHESSPFRRRPRWSTGAV